MYPPKHTHISIRVSIKHPEIKKQIMISDRFDQKYEHTILMRKKSNPTVEEINNLLDEMEGRGILDQLWEKYGINYSD